MNDESHRKPCSMWIGQNAQSVAGLLTELLARGHGPVLLWREPVNGRLPISGFAGLTTPGELPAQPRCALSEARLFFSSGMLHLLASAEGTRWAAWQEEPDQGPAGTAPAWLPSAEKPPLTVDLSKRSRTLLLSDGPGTRGLSGVRGIDEKKVTAVEYYDRGVLRWWRLDFHGTV